MQKYDRVRHGAFKLALLTQGKPRALPPMLATGTRLVLVIDKRGVERFLTVPVRRKPK